MKYRITTRLIKERGVSNIWYFVQQRKWLFFWKTIHETTHQEDAKELYFSLKTLHASIETDKLDTYTPPASGYQPRERPRGKRPVPPDCYPPPPPPPTRQFKA